MALTLDNSASHVNRPRCRRASPRQLRVFQFQLFSNFLYSILIMYFLPKLSRLRLPSPVFHSRLAARFLKSFSTMSRQKQPRILILGTSYAGLSAAVNILNLLKGNAQLTLPVPVPEISQPIPEDLKPEITLLDERDGFCMSISSTFQACSRRSNGVSIRFTMLFQDRVNAN